MIPKKKVKAKKKLKRRPKINPASVGLAMARKPKLPFRGF